MKILQINTQDIGGGAAKIAHDLFQGYLLRGHDSWLAVGRKKSIDPRIMKIPPPNQFYSPCTKALLQVKEWLRAKNQSMLGTWRLSNWVEWLARPRKKWDHYWGIEDFRYPGSRQIFISMPAKPNITHVHNLHGGYFDLRHLCELSHQFPLVWTLHDEWALTGHCAYTLGCSRWESGCGSCPDLSIFPAVHKDSTNYNWLRKQHISKRSRLYITTPSRWLKERVERSKLKTQDVRVIHNGIDLDIFHPPIDRVQVRKRLRFPRNVFIILAVAHVWNQFKDYATIEKAVHRVSDISEQKDREVLFVALGGSEDLDEFIGDIPVRKISYISDPKNVANYYQAADIFLHAANSENFPTTILESLACGTPVIATAVGGIPEQIANGETGFLVPPGDSNTMAKRILQLLQNKQLRQRLSDQSAETAHQHYGLERMVDEYIAFYQEILKRHGLQ